jgi:hypothetical protein
MKPISLKKEINRDPFVIKTMPSEFPTLWLDGLEGIKIPEEGEIRLRFSRISKTETEDREGERMSVQLKLKAITDLCDCKGRDAKNNDDEEGSDVEDMDADAVMQSLMDELDVEELDAMKDESEDDNPEKY